MKLSLLSAEKVQERAEARWGDALSDESLIDLLRAELTARGSCTRAATVHRVARAVTSSVPADEVVGRLRDLCKTLEMEGDFGQSAGGVLHVSPVRAVRLQVDQHRILSSLPTSRLADELPGVIETSGARRVHRFDAGTEPEVVGAVEQLGGVVVSPQSWAGLMFTPCADEAWVDHLNQRLAWQSKAAGSLDRDAGLDWAAMVLTEDGPKWRRDSDEALQLWRMRNSFGQWFWAWCAEGHSPSTGEFVQLSSDDASRTLFALARVNDHPVASSLVRDEGTAILDLKEWLPRAEYRYMAIIAALTRVENRFRWEIPISRLDDVLEVLHSRLGLTVLEEEPT